jgi:hypothetical protein
MGNRRGRKREDAEKRKGNTLGTEGGRERSRKDAHGIEETGKTPPIIGDPVKST